MTTTEGSRSPFTASQWEELEHQALVFKYMVSGVPIPTDLLSSIKRSLDSSLSSRLFSLQPMGWGYYQMGYGKKPDPEPGRCRRTDGKKWRCSKEAYPDSKYCERHMHRGTRSRKPVEFIANSSANSNNLSPSLTASISTDSYSNITPFSWSMPLPSQLQHSHQLSYRNGLVSPSIYSHSSTHNNTTPHLFLGPGSYYQADKDARSLHGVREAVDERSFFPETSGNLKSLHDSVTRMTMRSSNNVYSGFNFQSPSDAESDIKSSASSMRMEKREDLTHKPFHHFFSEWPPKSREHSRIVIGKNQSNDNALLATTHLSISMPLSTQDLFQTKS